MSEVTRLLATKWSAWAATFDDEPDHGLRDPVVREAWQRRLQAWLPRYERGRPARP